MIDPGLLGSVGPIVLGAGVGLLARRVINRYDAPPTEPPTTAPVPAAPPAPRPRPQVRPAVPAGRR